MEAFSKAIGKPAPSLTYAVDMNDNDPATTPPATTPPGAQAHSEVAPQRARSVSRNVISDRKAVLEAKAKAAEEAKAKAKTKANVKVGTKSLVAKGGKATSAPPAESPKSPLALGDGIVSPMPSLDLASTPKTPPAEPPPTPPTGSTGSTGSPKGKETTNGAKKGGAKKSGWGWSSKKKSKAGAGAGAGAGTSLDDTELKSPTLEANAAYQVGACVSV